MVLLIHPNDKRETLAIITRVRKSGKSELKSKDDRMTLREIRTGENTQERLISMERRDKTIGIAPWVTDTKRWTKCPDTCNPQRMSMTAGGVLYALNNRGTRKSNWKCPKAQ